MGTEHCINHYCECYTCGENHYRIHFFPSLQIVTSSVVSASRIWIQHLHAYANQELVFLRVLTCFYVKNDVVNSINFSVAYF